MFVCLSVHVCMSAAQDRRVWRTRQTCMAHKTDVYGAQDRRVWRTRQTCMVPISSVGSFGITGAGGGGGGFGCGCGWGGGLEGGGVGTADPDDGCYLCVLCAYVCVAFVFSEVI
jgi:hypothetical protein